MRHRPSVRGREVAFRLLLSVGIALFANTVIGVGGDGAIGEQTRDSEAQPERSFSLVKELIKDRAEARWAALAKQDFGAAYAFQTPGYREAITLQQYTGQFGSAVSWKSAEVTGVALEDPGDVARVTLVLHYTAPGVSASGEGPTMRRGIKETWIRNAGTWWFLQE